jgi:hypothetical protein
VNFFTQVDYVLVVATEGYLEDIASNEENKPSTSSRLTRKIFTLMRTELINAGCDNRRFIPVLANGLHYGRLPLLLQNTQVYKWPDGQMDLFRYLARRQLS